MKRFLIIATVLVAGMLLGAVLLGSAFAAGPTGQATPTPGAGNWGRGGMMGGAGTMGTGMMGAGYGAGGAFGFEDEVLSLLNITRDQLISELQSGKSMLQIAQAKGISEQTVVNTILAAHRADLDQLVSAGSLTQAQADAMYTNMQQTVPQMITSTAVGSMMGNSNGQPGNCPMWNNGQPGQPSTTQPTMPRRGGMMGRFNGPSA